MIKCNVCGSCKNKFLGSSGIFEFILCQECGLFFSHPLPSEETLSYYYHEFEAGKLIRAEMVKYSELAVRSLKHQISVIQLLGVKFDKVKKYLEIGFGGGHYLIAAERLGFEVSGVEVDQSSFESAIKEGRKLYNCELRAATFEDNSFDIVKAMHVLEHSKDPVGLIGEIFRVLKPRGFLILDVPNQTSFMAKLKIGLRLLGIERHDYGYVQPPLHIYGFSPKVLRRLFTRIGLITRKIVFTSPLDQLYFPTTKNYMSSFRGDLIKNAYRLFGCGSYISVYAQKGVL